MTDPLRDLTRFAIVRRFRPQFPGGRWVSGLKSAQATCRPKLIATIDLP